MGVQQSINLRFAVVKKETTPGTRIPPVAADHVIRLREPIFNPNIAFDDEGSKHANGSHAEDESLSGIQRGEFTTAVKMTFSGAVAVEPKWWELAKACGCEVKTYTTVGLGLLRRKANDAQSYSMDIYDVEIGEGSPVATIYQLAGVMGNMIMAAEATGAPHMANFTFNGKLIDIVDGSPFDLDAAVQTQLGEVFLSSDVTIGGTITGSTGAVSGGASEKIDAYSLDLGNVITPIPCQKEGTGILHFTATNAKPRLAVNPLAVKVATRDWLNEILTEVTSPVQIPIGTNLRLTMLDSQAMGPALATREGLVNWDLVFKGKQNGVPGTLADSGLTLEDTWELLQGVRV